MNIDANKEALDAFGSIIVDMMKDYALDEFEYLRTTQRGIDPLVGGLQKEVSALPDAIQEVIRDCIINSISTGIYGFLSKLFELHYHGHDAVAKVLINNVDIMSVSDGINTEYSSSTGWDSRFSKYPTNEDVLKKYAVKHSLKLHELLNC